MDGTLWRIHHRGAQRVGEMTFTGCQGELIPELELRVLQLQCPKGSLGELFVKNENRMGFMRIKGNLRIKMDALHPRLLF